MAAKNDSFMNWFGRQIGHVKRAVTTDVKKKPAAALPKAAAAAPQAEAPAQPAAAAAAADSSKIVYRDQTAEEIELPDRPGVKLRRTVIDEVIVEEKREVRSEKRDEDER